MTLWLFSDHSHRVVQSREVARHLHMEVQEFSTLQLERNGGIAGWVSQQPQPVIWPDVALGTGAAVAPFLLEVKALSAGKSVLCSILDPQRDREQFDLIALPGWEPYQAAPNIEPTVGLIHHVNHTLLETEKQKLEQGEYPWLQHQLSRLPRPWYVLNVGGKHVGGTITPEDIALLAKQITPVFAANGGSLLILTSKRTEQKTTDAFRQAFRFPHLLWDFHASDAPPNPYFPLLAVSDGIIATGDSVRNVCEACATGTPVWVWLPPSMHFNPYEKLHQQLLQAGALRMMEKEALIPYIPLKLAEAERISQIIHQKILSR